MFNLGGIKFLKNFLNSLPIGTAIVGMHGTIVAWDKQASKLFQFNEKQAIGIPIVDLFSERSKKSLEKYISVSPKLRRRVRRKIFKRLLANQPQYVEITFSNLRRDFGDVGVMLIFRDVTKEIRIDYDRRQAEEKNSQLLREVELQRERLRNLISSVPGVVWEAEGEPGEKNFRLKFVSEFIEKMVGYGAKEFLSVAKNKNKVIDYYEEKKVIENFKKSLEKRKRSGVVQFPLSKKDGKDIWTETHFSIIQNKSEKIGGITGVTLDITRRKQAEDRLRLHQQELAKSEERYRTIVELAPDVIYSIDTKGRFKELNSAFEKVTGWKREDWIGTPAVKLVHPDDRNLAKEKINDGTQGVESEPYELRLSTASGKYIFAEFRSKPQIINGKISGKFGVFRDITERKHEERQRSYMLGIASHEFKTPLASIKIFTQILQKQLKDAGNEKNLHYLAKIDQQINKLTKMVSDLLDIERIKAGRLEVLSEIFDFDEMVKDTISDLQPAFGTHTITLQGKTDRYIMGDKGRISRVLINLLSNAVKYSPGKNKVIVSVSSNLKTVTVGVQDFGIGIPPEEKDKIFEPFSRKTSTDNKKIPTTGLGLYISAELVRVHGGKIWAESTQSKGSTFYITLPIKGPAIRSEFVH